MPLSPFVVFLVWIPIGIYLFRRLPAPQALLANCFGGWAILPGACYIAQGSSIPYWVEGDSLPTTFLLTKATVTGFTALAGFALFHSPQFRHFRPRRIDLPVAILCAAPLLSAIAHPGAFPQACFAAFYLALSWGAPWLLGRICLTTPGLLLKAAKAAVLAGLCYVPICLVEVVTGPQLYAFLYGYEPYRWIGAERYLGFRPIGLMEDGNQLGIWMAAAALLAVALRAHQLAKRVAGIPMGVAAAVLAATTVLCQSVGSILLLFLLLPLTLSTRRSTLRLYAALAILGIVGFTLLLVATHGSLRAASQHNSILQTLAAILAKSGRGSLSWRLARDTNHIGLALHRPLLGYGSWAWWQNGDVRPWSLWLLLFGMYGAVGLLAFAAILFLPILAAVASLKAERNAARRQLAMAIVAVTLMIAADDLLNSAMILPYLLLFAGLASISIPPPSTLPRPPAGKAPRVVRPVSRVTSFSATPSAATSAATSAPRPRA